MNSNQLEYFPDLNFFLMFLKRYYVLLISLVIIFLLVGFYQFNKVKNNPIIEEKIQIEVKKKPNSIFKFIKEKYQNRSQVKALTSYIDLHEQVFTKINDMIKNNLKLKNAKFTHSFDNYKKSTFVISNSQISSEYPQEVNNNIINYYNDYIENYKNIEYVKLDRKVSQFLLDLTFDSGYPSVMFDNFSSGSDESKLKFLEDAFNQLAERGITQVPESIFGDLFLQDNKYKEIFVETIKKHLLENCNKTNNEDFFCSYIKLNNLEFDSDAVYQKRSCELASNSMDVKRVLLIIIDSKILCTEGFSLSKEIIFQPLDDFLEQINFYNGLYEIKIYSTSEKVDPSLLIYILYSLISAFFIFFLLGTVHSFFRNPK